jgi:hypothetical protein
LVEYPNLLIDRDIFPVTWNSDKSVRKLLDENPGWIITLLLQGFVVISLERQSDLGRNLPNTVKGRILSK